MPWTIRMEDEEGVLQSDDFLVLDFGSLPSGRDYPISTLIEAAPYYDSILNPVQVKALLVEIDPFSAARDSPLRPLRLLGEQAASHVYLRFLGD